MLQHNIPLQSTSQHTLIRWLESRDISLAYDFLILVKIVEICTSVSSTCDLQMRSLRFYKSISLDVQVLLTVIFKIQLLFVPLNV
jgi:hypothetical protein